MTGAAPGYARTMSVDSSATAFDPKVHGFHFRNSFDGLDIVTELGAGFLGSDLPSKVVPDDFWDTWGLCGGMAWHALDRYYARNPVPAGKSAPGLGSPVFNVLVARQVDSLQRWKMITRCLDWQKRPDEGAWLWRRGVGYLTQREEWPKLRDSIRRGYPVSLCLIRTKSNPAENHQVVATGYRHDDTSGLVEIDLYDPNRPDRTSLIRFRLGQAKHQLSATQGTDRPLRGFFVWPYDRAERRLAPA